MLLNEAAQIEVHCQTAAVPNTTLPQVAGQSGLSLKSSRQLFIANKILQKGMYNIRIYRVILSLVLCSLTEYKW